MQHSKNMQMPTTFPFAKHMRFCFNAIHAYVAVSKATLHAGADDLQTLLVRVLL
jgi:hypothetical protein